MLVEEGLIKIKLVAKMIMGDIKSFWDKFSLYITENRKIWKYPYYFYHTGYLYNELKRFYCAEWDPNMRLGHQVEDRTVKPLS